MNYELTNYITCISQLHSASAYFSFQCPRATKLIFLKILNRRQSFDYSEQQSRTVCRAFQDLIQWSGAVQLGSCAGPIKLHCLWEPIIIIMIACNSNSSGSPKLRDILVAKYFTQFLEPANLPVSAELSLLLQFWHSQFSSYC